MLLVVQVADSDRLLRVHKLQSGIRIEDIKGRIMMKSYVQLNNYYRYYSSKHMQDIFSEGLSLENQDEYRRVPNTFQNLQVHHEIYKKLHSSEQALQHILQCAGLFECSFLEVYQHGEILQYQLRLRNIPNTTSLKEYCKKHPRISPVDRYLIFQSLCRAIQFLHSKKVVHLNINEQSILIEEGKTHCRLIEFDYAVDLQSEETTALYPIINEDAEKLKHCETKERAPVRDIYQAIKIFNLIGKDMRNPVFQNVEGECLDPDLDEKYIPDLLPTIMESIKERIQNLDSQAEIQIPSQRNIPTSESNSSGSQSHEFSCVVISREIIAKPSVLQQVKSSPHIPTPNRVIGESSKTLFQNNIKKVQLIYQLFIINHQLLAQLKQKRLYSMIMLKYNRTIAKLKSWKIANEQMEYQKKLVHFSKRTQRISAKIKKEEENIWGWMLMCQCNMGDQEEEENLELLSDEDLYKQIIDKSSQLASKVSHHKIVRFKLWVILNFIKFYNELFNISVETDDQVLEDLYRMKQTFDSFKYSWFAVEEEHDPTDICNDIRQRYSIGGISA